MQLDDGDYWIDDFGAWNHVPPSQPCPFFPEPASRNRNAVDLAFRRLGMVRVSKYSETVTVQWDIAQACEESLNSACNLLWDLRLLRRIKLRFCYGGWTEEIFGGIRKALARLEMLRSFRHVTPFPGVRMKRVGEAAIGSATTPTIRRTRRLIAENGNRLDDDLWACLAAENLTDRVLLFREEDDGSWLSFRYIGHRSLFSRVFGAEVSTSIIGRHSTIDPATNLHGCYVSRAYPQVLAKGEEQVDQVLAPIKQANDDGIWVSYQRLLVPCSTRSGRRSLLVVADPTRERLIAA